MIAPEEAWRRIAETLEPLAVERVERSAAIGRALASPVTATGDLPAVDVSALDGFALAGAVEPGATLPVAARLAAGATPGLRLESGAAAEIWTGAPLPAGCDRVVGVEETEPAGADQVRVLRPPPAGNAVRRAAEIARAGAVLLAAGERLTPAALALLAGQGIGAVDVRRRPRVAVLVTGDEVVAPVQLPPPGSLRDSHTDFLLAAVAAAGGDGHPLGIARDEPATLAARLAPALDAFDVVLTCGGVSMGGADHVPGVLRQLGCAELFHGVAMQPGKPLLAGRRGTTLVFGLPGNPGSVMTAFRLLVRPALERLAGRAAGFWEGVFEVRLAAALGAGRARDRFVPARFAPDRGPALADPLPVAGSHDQLAFARAELLLRIRAGEPARPAGAAIEAIDF